MLFKGHFVLWRGTIYAILVEGIMKNIYVIEIVLNLGQCFRCHLKIFLFSALLAILFTKPKWFVNFDRGLYAELSCEIIFNLGQWFWSCHFKIIMFLALVTILFSRVKPFMQFW